MELVIEFSKQQCQFYSTKHNSIFVEVEVSEVIKEARER